MRAAGDGVFVWDVGWVRGSWGVGAVVGALEDVGVEVFAGDGWLWGRILVGVGAGRDEVGGAPCATPGEMIRWVSINAKWSAQLIYNDTA